MELPRDLQNLKRNELKAEQYTSGTYTPLFSSSPMVQKRQFNFINKNNNKTLHNDKNYYPNCDVNVWLRSCEREVEDPISGIVTGSIPEWLSGCLIRNGPGSLKAGKEEFAHLFDCSALLHRFHIKNGNITYQCKFLRSDIYKRNWTANRIVTTEFGTKAVPDPCHTIFQRVASIFTAKDAMSDNSMISVYPFGDELYAFSEIPIIHKINTETLETEKKVDMRDYVTIVHHTSHPHVTKDGTVYNLALSVHLTGPYHNIVMFPANESSESEERMFERASIVASIPARWPLNPSYMHTFGITDNYFVIVEQPLSVSLVGTITSKLKNEPLAANLRWYPEEMTQISVISRDTGELAHTFITQAFFYLHIINQYEIEDYLVLDICCYKDPGMIDCMYIETMKNMQYNSDYAKMFRSKPARFVMPLKPPMEAGHEQNLINLANTNAKAFHTDSGRILLKPEKLCNLGCETPRIHYEKFLGKPYRYFYAISADVDADNPGTIIKSDVCNKTTKTWCEENCYPSEPVFVPLPDAKDEDDGVILSAMVWGKGDTNHVGLLVLDAKTFCELGRAEFNTPSPVPKCLHGWFVQDAA